MNKGDWVVVEWIDADHDSGWQPDDPEADDTAEAMPSLGMFVSKGHKFITLSHCYNKGADEWLGKHRIPIAFVTDIYLIDKTAITKVTNE